jgi:glycosyltransferase involved in cell wall biosynthesis
VADDTVVAMTVGRLDLEKGYDLLLDTVPVLRRAPAWRRMALVWAGTGPLEPRLRPLARVAGGGAVHVLGERHDIPALLDAADLLVHPSRIEGMPLAVLEAMAKRLPVIASAVGGIPEALGGTGWLLPPPDDPAPFRTALADAIETLVRDAARRTAMGHAAYAHAQRHHTEARMVADWCALIRRTVGRYA